MAKLLTYVITIPTPLCVEIPHRSKSFVALLYWPIILEQFLAGHLDSSFAMWLESLHDLVLVYLIFSLQNISGSVHVRAYA